MRFSKTFLKLLLRCVTKFLLLVKIPVFCCAFQPRLDRCPHWITVTQCAPLCFRNSETQPRSSLQRLPNIHCAACPSNLIQQPQIVGFHVGAAQEFAGQLLLKSRNSNSLPDLAPLPFLWFFGAAPWSCEMQSPFLVPDVAELYTKLSAFSAKSSHRRISRVF